MIKNNYLIRNLDKILELENSLKQYHNKFISEIIHSSFLLAHDENLMTVSLSLDNEKYAFIFTDEDEFKKAFPADDILPIGYEMAELIEFLNEYKFDALILNVSGHNFYLRKEFLNNLKDLPSATINHSEAYSSEELKLLKNSTDNEKLEDFIKHPGDFSQLIEIISSNVLFGLAISDKDMDILECDGVVETWGLTDRYEFYSHDQYVALFTSEDRLRKVKTPKFKYLSLVDFATIAHYSIKNEYKGIIINPNDENYIIPIEPLLDNWTLINQTCYDHNLVTAKHTLFVID